MNDHKSKKGILKKETDSAKVAAMQGTTIPINKKGGLMLFLVRGYSERIGGYILGKYGWSELRGGNLLAGLK